MAAVRMGLSLFLLSCLSVLAAAAGEKTATNPQVGARFASVTRDFETEAGVLDKARGVDGFNPGDVNETLRKTKDATLSSIPTRDKPLRSYVERSFPEPVDESATVVQKDVVEKRFSLVRELLAKLTRLDSFRLDLTVNTKPSSARFELIPKLGTHLTSTTNSRLTNIYRGEYDYVITKAGYKRVHETINFIERAGNVLECDLQPDPGPEEALPCNFR